MTNISHQKNGSHSGPADEQAPTVTTGRAAYNIVTDTVTGVNVRRKDNKFQALFVLGSMFLLALLGSLFAVVNPEWQLPWYGGALIGSFLGLVFGVIASGIFLMFYRAWMHLSGKHD